MADETRNTAPESLREIDRQTPTGEMLAHAARQSRDKGLDDVLVIDVEGQLIVGNREELKQKVLDEIHKGERSFVVNFSETGYIDSSGLGVLVSLSKKIREKDGELRLASLNEDLRTLFELTKLDTLLPIVDTREEALEGL